MKKVICDDKECDKRYKVGKSSCSLHYDGWNVRVWVIDRYTDIQYVHKDIISRYFSCKERDNKKFSEDKKKRFFEMVFKTDDYIVVEGFPDAEFTKQIKEMTGEEFSWNGEYYKVSWLKKCYYEIFNEDEDELFFGLERNLKQKIKTLEIKNHSFFENCKLNFKKINFLIGNNGTGKTLFLRCLMNERAKGSKEKNDCDKELFIINGLPVNEFCQDIKTYAYFIADKNLEKLTFAGQDDDVNSKYYIPYNFCSIGIVNAFLSTPYFHFLRPAKKLLDIIAGPDTLKKLIENESDISECFGYSYKEFISCNKKLLDNCICQSPTEFLNLYESESQSHYKPKSPTESLLVSLKLALFSNLNERDIIIIDEPEIHLHPKAQMNFIESIFDGIDNQIILATHSPYIFKDFIDENDVAIFYFYQQKENGKISIEDVKERFIFKGTSIGEINYHAFGLAGEEFHNDLYGFIERKEEWMKAFKESQKKTKIYKKINRDKKNSETNIILPEYIRNQIHHSENPMNEKFTYEELNKSIEMMIEFIERTILQNEKISKQKAKQLFDSGDIDKVEVGTFTGLVSIHAYLFKEIYDSAGKIRKVNISRGDFSFEKPMHLKRLLADIDAMPQGNFDEIIEKYVKMNIAHPFSEGNGRATRIWLDLILKKELKQAVDWNAVDKDDYLSSMQRSVLKDVEIKTLLQAALTKKIDDRDLFIKGIDASYHYEGYSAFKTEAL